MPQLGSAVVVRAQSARRAERQERTARRQQRPARRLAGGAGWLAISLLQRRQRERLGARSCRPARARGADRTGRPQPRLQHPSLRNRRLARAAPGRVAPSSLRRPGDRPPPNGDSGKRKEKKLWSRRGPRGLCLLPRTPPSDAALAVYHQEEDGRGAQRHGFPNWLQSRQRTEGRSWSSQGAVSVTTFKEAKPPSMHTVCEPPAPRRSVSARQERVAERNHGCLEAPTPRRPWRRPVGCWGRPASYAILRKPATRNPEGRAASAQEGRGGNLLAARGRNQ